MILTCLANGCKEQVPAWSWLCAEHVWMAGVERMMDQAMDDVYAGQSERAVRRLERAIEKIREESRDRADAS